MATAPKVEGASSQEGALGAGNTAFPPVSSPFGYARYTRPNSYLRPKLFSSSVSPDYARLRPIFDPAGETFRGRGASSLRGAVGEDYHFFV